MTKGDDSEKTRGVPTDHGFTDIVLSWSLEDIENENLYKNQVEKIPQSFESVRQYFGSYVYPLLEETRAQLHSSMVDIISRAPFAKVIAFSESKKYGTKLYDLEVDEWRNKLTIRGKEPYKTLPGDIFVLANAKLEDVSDLQRIGRQWAFVAVTNIPEEVHEDDSPSTSFKVKALKDIEVDAGNHKSWFVIFLIHTIPNKRIWNALQMQGNLQIIKKVLSTNSLIEEDCDLCSAESDVSWHEKFGTSIPSREIPEYRLVRHLHRPRHHTHLLARRWPTYCVLKSAYTHQR